MCGSAPVGVVGRKAVTTLELAQDILKRCEHPQTWAISRDEAERLAQRVLWLETELRNPAWKAAHNA